MNDQTTPPGSPARREYDSRMQKVQDDVTELRAHVEQVKKDVADNTAVTKKISDDTSTMLEFWRTMEGGFKVLVALGKVAKWVAIISTAIASISAAFYAVTHFGAADIPKIDIPK